MFEVSPTGTTRFLDVYYRLLILCWKIVLQFLLFGARPYGMAGPLRACWEGGGDRSHRLVELCDILPSEG